MPYRPEKSGDRRDGERRGNEEVETRDRAEIHDIYPEIFPIRDIEERIVLSGGAGAGEQMTPP
ncbi:hypothetical protein E2N92_04125 [Methanofollis formosanus]|uniref:Uncharacterized protein n=1 Tax=Methanofollis formosanus TaxID=299308 RepID=A0A8G1A0Y2_9EURY|nr:hypothetical protein E2N92_04125 [Methanofollis formosanus]